MLLTKNKILLLGSILLVLHSPVARSWLVEFSSGLYDYVSKRFNREAPRRLQIMQTTVRQIKSSLAADFNTQILRSKDAQYEMQVLRKTNDFYNQIPYFNDSVHWNMDDFWATPVEFVATLGGDCEDYAIAKYLTLKELGVPIERLKITYVRAIQIGETHMVLAYYPTPDGEPWILDNLIPEIKLAAQRPDLVPVYSFNDDDLWLASGMTRKGGASSVRLWRELAEKREKENKM